VLENLDLAENDISDEAGVPFATFMENNIFFKKVGLRKNELTTETGRIFEKSLRLGSLKQLRKLDLSA